MDQQIEEEIIMSLKINPENQVQPLAVKELRLTQRMQAMLTIIAASQGFLEKSPTELNNLLLLFAESKPWLHLTEQDREKLRRYINQWHLKDFI